MDEVGLLVAARLSTSCFDAPLQATCGLSCRGVAAGGSLEESMVQQKKGLDMTRLRAAGSAPSRHPALILYSLILLELLLVHGPAG